MKATKFIKLSRELCNAHIEINGGDGCPECPLCVDKGSGACGMVHMKPRTLVKAVKSWAKGKSYSAKKPVENACKSLQPTKSDELTLKEFLIRWTRSNTLVRLWVPKGDGHIILADSTPSNESEPMVCSEPATVGMGWAIVNGTSWQARFADWRVMYVADILCDSYKEAVNIVLDPMDSANEPACEP